MARPSDQFTDEQKAEPVTLGTLLDVLDRYQWSRPDYRVSEVVEMATAGIIEKAEARRMLRVTEYLEGEDK